MAKIGTMIALAKALGTPNNTQVNSAVSAWLAAHPEATTTVQDGAVTEAKLASALSNKLAKSGSLASNYSSSSTYAAGDYVWYNGTLYRCAVAVTTAEAWTASRWEAVAVGDSVADIKSNLDNFVLGGESVRNLKAMNRFSTWIEKKTIDANGEVHNNNDVMYCNAFFSVEEYAHNGKLNFYDRTEVNGYFIAVAFYNSSKSFISRVGFESGERDISITAPENSVYFRIVLVFKVYGSAVTALISNVHLDQIYIVKYGEYAGAMADLEELNNKMNKVADAPDTMDLPPAFISSTMKTPGQGLAKVGNNFVISKAGTSSYDSAGSTANINVYDSSFTSVGTMHHDLGHGSGLCYNPTYDVFLMANGDASVSPRLDILLNASSNVESAIGGSTPEYLFGGDNVMSIYLTKNGQELLDNADGACWCVAGNDRLVIISLRDVNKNRVFYIGMLGVGSNDFSLLDNGYGTYVSGKSDTELNGTIKIIKKYDPISDTISSAQGIFYDKGKLIVSSSKANCLFYKIALCDNGYKILEKYRCAFYKADGTENSCEPEGIVKVGDGHFYCATTQGVIEIYA